MGEGEAGRSEGWGYDVGAGEVWMERLVSFLLERPCWQGGVNGKFLGPD